MPAERTVAVFGAGAVGCHLGAHLALGRVTPALDLTLVGRPSTVDAINAHGVILEENGNRTIVHARAIESEATFPPQDLVLLTVRTFDVDGAIPDLRRLLGSSGLLLAFQNGIGTEEQLAGAFGRDRVLACASTISVGMESRGVITRYSRGGGIALSMMNGTAVPHWLLDAFAASGLPSITVEKYPSLRWSKLLLNMLGAATTAILDMDVDDVMAHPDLFRLEQLAFREAGRVMDAQGIKTIALPGYPVPLARLAMRLPRQLAQRILGPRVGSARSGRSPGMRDDMHRGRTEVAAFNGAVAEGGKRAGVPTPTNAALAELTLELARNPEQRDRFRGLPEVLVEYARTRGVNV